MLGLPERVFGHVPKPRKYTTEQLAEIENILSEFNVESLKFPSPTSDFAKAKSFLSGCSINLKLTSAQQIFNTT